MEREKVTPEMQGIMDSMVARTRRIEQEAKRLNRKGTDIKAIHERISEERRMLQREAAQLRRIKHTAETNDTT